MAATTATATAAAATATPSPWRNSSSRNVADGDADNGLNLVASPAGSPNQIVTDDVGVAVEVPSPSTQSYGGSRGDGISLKSPPPSCSTKTAPATSAAAGSNGSPEQATNTATVSPQVVTDSSADGQGAAAVRAAPVTPPTMAAATDASANGENNHNNDAVVVDSALQAALREPRERMALLRLESLLVDFCRTESAGWLEVSGLYNATWIGPQLAGRSPSSSLSASQQANIYATSNGNGGGTPYGTNSVVPWLPTTATTPFGQYGYGPSVAMTGHSVGGGTGHQQLPQQPPPRPATSFQRCVLHRLADRFGIVRECGSVMEGSIRLIKVPETKIPPRLLQDMDPFEYSIEAVTMAMSQSHVGDSRPPQALGVPPTSYADSVIPPGTAQNPTPAAASTLASAPRSSRKMKIMKRSESTRSRSSTPSHNNSNHGPGSSTSSGGGRRDSAAPAGGARNSLGPGTDLSERERAYAEARARIFRNHDDGSGNADDATNGDGDGEHSSDVVPTNPLTASALDYEDDPSGPVSTPALAFAAAAAASAAANYRSPQKSAPINPSDAAGGGGGVDQLAASMTVTENKATYRNRLEEAADPDFKRGVAVPVVAPAAQLPPPVLHHLAPPYPYATPATNASSALGVPTAAIPYAQQHHQHHYQPHVGTTTAAMAAAGPDYHLNYAPALTTGCYSYGLYAPAASHFPALQTSATTAASSSSAAAPRAATTPPTVRTSLPKLAANAPAFSPSWASAAAAASASSSTTSPSKDPPAASQR